MSTSSQKHQVPHSVDEEECSHLLPWLRRKAGAEISSHLTIGKSVYGRSLFASKPIQAGDCILKIPRSAHLTADSLHPSVSSLLGEGFADDVKLALVVLQHQKLGQASEWAPYISCLPRVEEMHSTMLWSDEELEMIKTSLLYDATLERKAHIEKIYLSIKHVLDRFPEYFEDVTLDKFKHAYNLEYWSNLELGVTEGVVQWSDLACCNYFKPAFLTSASALVTKCNRLMLAFTSMFKAVALAKFTAVDSNSSVTHTLDDFEQQFIAGKNYAPGDEVFIRYLDVSNFELLLQYGFMIPFSEYDTVLVEITVPQHDHLRALKLDLLYRHSIQGRMGFKKPNSCRNYFILENDNSSEGWGISIPLRAFARVLCCTSPQELQQLVMEATEDDGHLARYPLKNKEREMEAHRFLHLRFDDMIENHRAALESLTRAASPTLSGKCARRMQLARDLLTSDLQILRSATAWLKNYSETLKV
ncbi:SET domain-containing protein [Tanacetum coccineum]|uniref:SET domain-containing protein n=1 Tax=Tanacetum coccineum TaxID=301880 RepID=A0ABQ5AU88_9ASTR